MSATMFSTKSNSSSNVITVSRQSQRLCWPGAAVQSVMNASCITFLSAQIEQPVSNVPDEWEQVQAALDNERSAAGARLLFPDRHER
jgi:hypothetical protein